MKKTLITLGLAALLSTSAFAEKVQVGVVMKSLANEFWKTVEVGAKEYADKNKDVFEMEAIGLKDESDVDTQINTLESFITKQKDIIAVAPANSVALIPSIKRALDAGIIVVNFDVRLDKKASKQMGLPDDFLFVGPNNEQGAYEVGDFLAKSLPKNAKVFIIEGNPGAENAIERKRGFMKVVEENKLNLLASRTAHWETEEANTVMTNLLTKYPDVQGVMCANDSMVLGVVKAIEAAGKTGQIKVVGFDNIAPVQDLMKKGKVLASEDFFGKDLAVNAIKIGLRIHSGEKLSGWVKTPVKLVTAEDLKK
ncbi:sugar ABC transporter substrate-binding protein [Pasteurella skyensis]|uniref:Sugar ABC transporter substrate-binding protein n=1 Tax=Phocoenobacter skyensis TaxID=97481 RepID=A0AAJ6P3I2_9PAST|nr:sugar ABC transporter substrate-binding protein [Pasteurella skyensis]MDP8170000.1 sugar ABC transporter substrate-binding protein [Pasteurella skyensis]MDP8175788.1 sugar ABC transporter substrate-binding protein [Pasteurella skyensis]